MSKVMSYRIAGNVIENNNVMKMTSLPEREQERSHF